MVVGAGPTGLALAIQLRLNKIPVLLVDAAAGPARTSRALGLQSRGTEVLERMGALGDLPQRAQSALTMSYREGRRTLLTLQVGRAVPKTLLISQAEVEKALRERLAALGGAVDWSTRVVGFSQTGTEVLVDLERPDGRRRCSVAWLVGCDGAHSVVRKAAEIGFPGRPLVERLLMIDVRAELPFPADGSITWMDPGRTMSVTAMPEGVWRIFTETPPGVPEQLTESQVAETVLHEFCSRTGIEQIDPARVSWASEFRIHRRLADTYRRGRVLIAGDAAHIQSPSGGQGQNTGLGDAENLGWKLGLVAAGVASERLLDTYQEERRPLAARVLGATTAAVTIMLPERWWQRWLRDTVVLPIMRHPAVQKRLWDAASQLHISYRGGPLALRHHGQRRHPRPGERVPDLLCCRADGGRSRLHGAIDGRWAVLAPDWATAADHQRVAAALLGACRVVALVPASDSLPDVVLVRPDGHVGWRGLPDPTNLSAWLRSVLNGRA